MAELATKRILSSWEKKKEIELEKIRSQIAHEQTMLNFAIQNFSSGYTLAQERRLQAIEALWKKVLDLGNFASPTLFAYKVANRDILLNAGEFKKILSILKEEDRIHHIYSALTDVEVFRPYLGEDIWLMFVAYTMMVGGITLEVIKAVEKDNFKEFNPSCWSPNLPPLVLERLKLSSLLPDDEVAALIKEHLIVMIELIVSGKKAANDGVSNVAEIEILMAQIGQQRIKSAS